jgi:WD40 repeat protein
MFPLPTLLQFYLLLQTSFALQQAVLDVFPHATRQVLFSPDGKILAARTRDPKTGSDYLEQWDTETCKRRSTLSFKLRKYDLFGFHAAFSADSKTLVGTGANEPIRLWDVAKGEVRDTLLPGKDGAGAAVFTTDGKTLIVFAGKGLQFWDLEKRDVVAEIEDAGTFHNMILSADGKRLAVREGGNGRVTVYDLKTRKPIRTWRDGMAEGRREAFGFSPDGTSVAVGTGSKHAAAILDVETGEVVDFIPRLKDRFLVTATGLVFSPDGKTLAVVSHYWVHFYDVKKQRILSSIVATGGPEPATCVAFSPDGKTLAVGGAETWIRLFDVPVRSKE